ncbi:MAG: hypothetical protein CL573_09935 [Alphaproteobacteria bacterium]|nr:hypothetical protein [Alphaproteobacteria bacterium]
MLRAKTLGSSDQQRREERMTLSDCDLIGAWTLDEMYAEGAEGAKTYPMGQDADGMIMYTPDSHMSAIVHFADRLLPVDRANDEERAKAFSSYFNYAGTWKLEDDTVTHTITHALDPNMVGMSLSRAIVKDGARVIFSGLGHDGVTRQCIIWKRPG